MCMKQPKAQAQVVQAPTPPPTPMRNDEENRAAVDEALEEARRRRGAGATVLTGGLGDAGFGMSIDKPRATALGG